MAGFGRQCLTFEFYYKTVSSIKIDSMDSGRVGCDVMLISLVYGYQHFGGTYRLHLQLLTNVPPKDWQPPT
jgi:hypothetical protein